MLILLISCTEKTKHNCPTYYVDLEKGYDIENNSDFIKSYKYIPLQTDTSCIIGDIKKIRILDDRIYITDRFRKRLFVFDISGKFIGKINNVGKGPTEYLWIGGFSVNKDFIYLFGNKNLKYDRDLNLINTSPHLFTWIDKEMIGDTIVNYSFGFTDGIHHELQYIYDDGIVNNSFKTPETRTVYFGERSKHCFYHYKDTILLQRMLNHTIYTLTPQGPKPRYIFDFGKYNPPSVFFEKCQEKDLIYCIREANKNKYIDHIFSLAENKDYITLETKFGGAIINKHTQKAGRLRIKQEDPNVLITQPKISYNEKFISVIDAVVFVEHFKKQDQNELLPEIKSLIKSVNFDDNPVIAIYEYNSNAKIYNEEKNDN